MNEFIVTEKAKRPAKPDENGCFYCQQPIGQPHKIDCVLVCRKVKVKLVIEYEIVVPAFWNEHDVEFHRNESSWCKSNLISELEEVNKERCLCSIAKFEHIGNISEEYLRE